MEKVEINAKVYEKIFGAKWYAKDGKRSLFLPETGNQICRLYGFTEATGDEPIDWEEIERGENPYCTDLNYAWKVVETLREKWQSYDPVETYYFQFVDCCEYGWRVDVIFAHHDGDAEISSKTDKSLPMAICLASLDAIGCGDVDVSVLSDTPKLFEKEIDVI